jgi:hypothetical protein
MPERARQLIAPGLGFGLAPELSARDGMAFPAGLEPATAGLENPVAQSVIDGGGESRGGEVGGPSSIPSSQEQDGAPMDPELESVINAWEDLPAAVRAGIVAMVRPAGTT